MTLQVTEGSSRRETAAGVRREEARPAETGGPGWLDRRRSSAALAYRALAKPSSHHDEDWRRTDISSLDIERFDDRPSAADHDEALIGRLRLYRDRIDPEAAFVANTRAGVVAAEQLDRLTAQGITVVSIDEAAERHPELVARALDAMRVDTSTFLSLWLARFRGGCFVHVPAGVTAAAPIVIGHTTGGDGASLFPATLALIDDNASATIAEVYSSPDTAVGPAIADDEILCAAATVMVLGRNAGLDYLTVQHWGDGVWHFATQRAVIGADARLRFFGAALGARLQKVHWEAILAGQGADASVNGLVFADGSRHADTQSLQAHTAPHTRSNLFLKVAVRDTGRSVYSGMIDVDRTAQQTDGYVQNRNLILSQGARASGVPRLEIRANDVQCGHGATVGHVDDEQRFYLESRGVPTDVAEQIIVRGFFDDVLRHSPHPGFVEMMNILLDGSVGGRSSAGDMA